jgi:2'-5' RNA ligase
MKKTEMVMPGYRMNDYILILNPSLELSNKISTIRDEFNKEYKVPATPGKPNLLICSFTQLAMMEERIIRNLGQIAMAYPPFKVEVKDFGSFPSHTIYVKVVSKVPIQALVRKVRSEAQALMKFNDDHKPYFSSEPHFTLGRKLKPWQYEKAWLAYSNKHFTGRFIASEMLLLKREHEGDKSWQVAKHFKFENLPIVTKQGELFQ